MLQILASVDRRVLFALMALAVGVPIAIGFVFPGSPGPQTQRVFDRIEAVPEGGRVLMCWDYDPASAGELSPMGTAMARHAASRNLKMVFLCIFSPASEPMIDDSINNVIRADFPQLKYGTDYVNLGYKAGNEGVIKVIATNFAAQFAADARGTPIGDLPILEGVRSVRDFDLLLNVSAGYPGTKEWVQYAQAPYPGDVTIVAGATGVQAPLLFPYVPQQLAGLLVAIKGAAEYEQLVMTAYPDPGEDPETGEGGRGEYKEARRRMGPQLFGHLLMIALIVAGNVVYFSGATPRKAAPRDSREGRSAAGTVIALTLLAGVMGYAALVGSHVDVAPTGLGAAEATPAEQTLGVVVFSPSRTIGLWVAALGTLFLFSFLWRDNPAYKVAEAVLVGVSASYWMVVAFWSVIVPDVLGVLLPGWTKGWATPAASGELRTWDSVGDWTQWWALTLVPLGLGVLLLMRLSPKGGWLSRWPLAFIIGTFSGLRLCGFLSADFLGQIKAGVKPLVAFDASGFDLDTTFRNWLLVFGCLAALTYFFFSARQKGAVGRVARAGVLLLMITFGAAFGSTVMGRIALLAARLEFLLNDWLWVIDPSGSRFVG